MSPELRGRTHQKDGSSSDGKVLVQTIPVAAKATGDVEVPSRRNRYWQNRKCTACGWIWNPQVLEQTGQVGAPPGIEAPTEVQDTEMVAPKAKPPKPVGATLDSALARQTRAKKNLALVEVQLTTIQLKMEEARAEMVLADKAVNEARQFADVEVLLQAMRMQPQQQTLDPAVRQALARMTDALTSMRAMQQAQQPDGHAGNGAFPRTAGHAGSCAARSHATSGEHCSWTKARKVRGRLWRDASALQRKSCEKDWRTTRSSGAESSKLSTTDLHPVERWDWEAGWRSPSSSARRAPMTEADPRKVDGQKSTMEDDTRKQNW